eukprot:TRINITY_DN891_c2_g2_i3.p1 TRINITY_DN891_c2_g2~~TRINITY_DN891_c2_g2_i3.p1  ORF type:complete len:815 (-),score=138.90 TRINITY_DN891_c2_g2_i3:249-2693(-)
MDFFFFLHVLLLSCCCCFFNTHIVKAADSISPGQSLTGDQTITSKEGNFVLGFFTPGNSSNYYIGIWYKKVQVQTIVWVANREAPLPDKSSQLKISQDGNLVLINQTNIPVWSTNINSNTSNSTVAVLHDNGNLVLSDGSNSSVVIWQSFDYPTHTWLPTGRLGLNKITGRNQQLTSWRSIEDPAPGPFSLEIDPNGTSQYIIVWNGFRRYWTSGEWNGQIFSLVPEMTLNYIYNFTFESDEKGNYFNYTVKDPSTISRFVMDVSGQIKQLSWLDQSKQWNLFWSQPRAQCEVFYLCGAFGMCNEKAMPFCECVQGFEARSQKEWNLSDWAGGCKRKTHLRCGNNSSANGEDDKFLPIPNMLFPEKPISRTVSSIDDCELACLNNCSCTAYAYDGGCSIWSGDLVNLRVASDNQGKDLYLRLAASELPTSSSKKGKVTVATVAAAVGAVAVLGIVLAVIWRCRRRRSSLSLKATEGSLVPFGYRDLQIITKNFSEKLGGGGFGSVFKGIYPDSTAVAVKKLEGLRQGDKQFRTEVSTIGTIQHVNLIRLRGFCSEGDNRLLVYDYMPNGSLDAHLFGSKSDTLDWKTRYQIALGTARGLAYLHEKCRDCIIHCDIKPENILLDVTFCPKVADFGLAKLMGREFSRVLTTMRGTRGYLAPEWISGSPITSKADVFSYGMMLFEVISGRRNSEQSEDGKIFFFPTWAVKKLIEGEVLSLLDHKLESNADTVELIRAARVACWCIQDDENDRPSMGQVVQILEGILEVNMPQIPRCLQILVGNTFLSDNSSALSSHAQSNGSISSQAKSSSSTTSKQ